MRPTTLLPLAMAVASASALNRTVALPRSLRARQTVTQQDVCASIINKPLSVAVLPGLPPVTIGLIGAYLFSSFRPAR
jgi:hypothetical protein